MNYEGMSSPQSALCSKVMCLNVSLVVIKYICFCSYLEGYWLQPVLTRLPGRLPTETLALGFPWCPCVPFVSNLRIPSTAIHRGHAGSFFIPFWALFKCLLFLCFQIICAPPSLNSCFSKGSHSGQ